MSHSFQGFQPLSRHLCWELRGFYSFNFRLFLLVLYRTYHFWELTNNNAPVCFCSKVLGVYTPRVGPLQFHRRLQGG